MPTKIDKQSIIDEGQQVLENYHNVWPETTDESGFGLGSPKMTWAPNHPNVVEKDLDKPILRNMNADMYCYLCKMIILRIGLARGGATYSWLLRNKYLTLDFQGNRPLMIKMEVSKKTFFRILNDALLLFGRQWKTFAYKRN